MRIVAIDGSPHGHGRTETVLRAVLTAAEAEGASTELLAIVDGPLDAAVDAIDAADGVVFGSPVYRASFAFPLKELLDNLPRGMNGESSAPLRGKAVAIVATSASLHHFLALDDLRSVLASFFAAHVLPPGLHVPREGFSEDGALDAMFAEQASQVGRGVVELAGALGRSTTLRALAPQA